MENHEKGSVAVRFLDGGRRAFHAVRQLRRNVNQRMRRHYSAGKMALWSTLACAVLMIIMLFVPSYLGVADDGSAQKLLGSAGLAYLKEDREEPLNYYFVKTYQKVVPDTEMVSVQMLLVRAAMLLSLIHI